ncbi:MAG: HD domain-containing protein [Candidatus Omnitrophica bacterium]|nr:HD domain-containing protein [Candidatus Omnitrophota bacterium]
MTVTELLYLLFLVFGFTVGFRIAEVIYRRQTRLFQEMLRRRSRAPAILPAQPAQPVLESEDMLWHEEETSFIFKLNEKLSLTLDRSRFARCIVENAYEFLYVEKAILLLVDQHTQKLKVAYAIGVTSNADRDIELERRESISGHVFTEQETLVIDDLDQDFYLKKINKEPYFRKSFVSVPLLFERESVGVLHVCDKKPDRLFKKRDISFLRNVSRLAAIAFQNIKMHEEMQESYITTIAALATALDERDRYTRWHSENVTRYALALACELHLGIFQTEVLRRAALLHDIGKIGIRDDILLKAGKLTDEEHIQITLHPQKGEEIVRPLPFLRDSALLIRHHHERYDGGGYPDGIKGEAIELGARIMAIADSFDAMTSDRVYRKALSLDMAKNELINNKGTQFDPELVDCFIRILGHNPDIIKTPAE